jgi:hypothetical protein
MSYLNNYLTEILDYESTVDFVIFNNTKIKTSYIIDLSSYFISQYLFFGLEEIPLSSVITRQRYGCNYNIIVQYLLDKRVIFFHKDYMKGKHVRSYRINKNILEGEIFGYKNFDKFLLKKHKKLLDISINSESENKIPSNIKEKLIRFLYLAKLDEESTEILLNTIKVDREIYLKNKHSIDCINNKQIFFHFDSYGRMHTNFTNLKSIFRKQCLFINGKKTTEIDIKNSQPLFLNKLIEEHKSEFKFDGEELELYRNLTFNGKFYDYINSKVQVENKKKLKDLVYKLFFGKNHPNKFEKEFSKIFPTIYKFIKFYKNKTGDYKNFSYKLQELESNLIFNKIVKQIMDYDSNLPVITIHDSILCTVDKRDIVSKIFRENLVEYFGMEIKEEAHNTFDFNIY